MRLLTLDQTAAFLEFASIHKTIDVGHALIHIGENAFGCKFVLVNNMLGQTVLTEEM